MPSSTESVDKAQRGTNLMKLKVTGLLCALPSSKASVSTRSGPFCLLVLLVWPSVLRALPYPAPASPDCRQCVQPGSSEPPEK